jgi:hypothetical protein
VTAAVAAAWQQCSIGVSGSAVAAVCHQHSGGGQQCSGAAMFPLFITHDEYFVRCGGNGEGYYNVFYLSSYNFLVDKNSVMYSLHTNIVPQYGYEGTTN